MQGYGAVGMEVVKMTALNDLDRLICKWPQSGLEVSDILSFVIWSSRKMLVGVRCIGTE